MEQIVYCQDQMYQSSLQKIRAKEKEKEEEMKKKFNCLNLQQSSSNSLDEIFQHLTAYHQVSLHVPRESGFHVASFS